MSGYLKKNGWTNGLKEVGLDEAKGNENVHGSEVRAEETMGGCGNYRPCDVYCDATLSGARFGGGGSLRHSIRWKVSMGRGL